MSTMYDGTPNDLLGAGTQARLATFYLARAIGAQDRDFRATAKDEAAMAKAAAKELIAMPLGQSDLAKALIALANATIAQADQVIAWAKLPA